MNLQKDESPRSLHHLSFSTESLESRTLLDAASSNIVSALSFSIGLPIASLATGSNLPVPSSMGQNSSQTTQEVSQEITGGPDQPVPGIGLAMPAQDLQGFTTSVSLPLVQSSYGAPPGGNSSLATPFGQPYNGPAPALSPPGYASESAVAASSEVRSPTPGRSDRISTIVRAIPIIPLPHYESPESEVQAMPEIIPLPPVAAPNQQAPDQQEPKQVIPNKPAEPVSPPPMIERGVVPAPEPAPAIPKGPMTFDAFDEAIGLVEADLSEVHSNLVPERAEQSMALRALLAAWGGWNIAARKRGSSRQRPLVVTGLEAGPGL